MTLAALLLGHRQWATSPAHQTLPCTYIIGLQLVECH